jgi:hypothetical protein
MDECGVQSFVGAGLHQRIPTGVQQCAQQDDEQNRPGHGLLKLSVRSVLRSSCSAIDLAFQAWAV